MWNASCFPARNMDVESPNLTKKERIIYAKEQMLGTFQKVFPYVLIGVGIGALIHNWIPENWIVTALGSNNPFGVILATIVGVPMYADIFGTIPIAEALLSKGAQLGTVLSLDDGGYNLSLPVFDHASQGNSIQVASAVHWNLFDGYYFSWLICLMHFKLF